MDSGSAFIGRAAELELIAARASAARRGAGGVVLISGEPGIGKSRLAEQAAARATTAGMRTARARVPQDEGCPPYWVFRQLLGQRLPEQDPVGRDARALAGTLAGRGDGPLTRREAEAEGGAT